jgi:hypothetical protein
VLVDLAFRQLGEAIVSLLFLGEGCFQQAPMTIPLVLEKRGPTRGGAG